MRAFLFALLLPLAAVPAPPGAPADPDLVAGISLVKEGDFEAAVVRLDAAVRRLDTQPARKGELARAYLYLGVAFLELDQELLAKAKFRECLLQNRNLELSPREFSAQVIRVFEAERQSLVGPEASKEAARAAAEPPKRRPEPKASPPAAPTPKNAGETKRHSKKGVYLVLGGGAAVAGTALVLSGGGDGSTSSTGTQPTTTSTSEPASTTTTTTPSTTTNPPTTQLPGCNYQLSPNSQSFSAAGGTGVCQVRTNRSGCPWGAESTEAWIQLTGSTSGTGDGGVSFVVLANSGGARTGQVRLREERQQSCEIRQAGLLLQANTQAAAPADPHPGRDRGDSPQQPPEVIWESRLDVPGGQGQAVLNGSEARFHGPGPSRGSGAPRSGENRIEAVLVTAESRPGVWRFELAGRAKPGTLRVIAGHVAGLTATSVAFLMQGSPGERVVFAFGGD